MNFPKHYKKDTLDDDLKQNTKFTFKGKNILILLFIIPFAISIIIGIFISLSGLFLIAIFEILIISIPSGFFAYYTINRAIHIDQEGIRWRTIFSSHYIKFIDIEDLSFFPSAFTNLETLKLFLYNKMKFRIRTTLMTAPKKWDSEDMIRIIIEYYWPKANPEAKYSTKSVSTTPTPTSAKISLINPRKSEIDSLQGYKCPNCLIIQDEKHEFCPKCGAKMN